MATEENKKNVTREFKLTNFSVSNRTSVLILTLIIIFSGWNAYRTMPKESFPEIVFPFIYVGTVYPGNSPVDIENLVTRPIEKELKSINGVKVIRSTSVQDVSTINVEFNPEVDVETALQDVKDAVDRAKSNLPTDLDTDPNVFEIDLSELPIMFINLSGNYSLQELKIFGEYLQDEIEALPQISKVDIRGALEREIRIDADPFRMEAMEISFGDIIGAVSAENVTISGGNILMDDFRRSLRVVGEFETVSQIEDVIVKDQDQRIVYLRDVATVRDSNEEPASYARADKDPVITLNVVKRGGENLIEAADQIKAIIAGAQTSQRLPKDLNVSITNDQSKFTRSQLDNLENSIISGVILVVLVLLFFLGLRNALFVGVAIPLSMLISFSILNAYGVTLNLMVLFSLILALGMLVDNGIVVVENIYRLMSQGMKPIQAAKEGVGEVAWPIIASTATTLAAFLPLAFWQSTIGEFFKFLPITLIIVLSSSLFVALVINPVLTAMYMKVGRTKIRKARLLIAAAISLVLGIVLSIGGQQFLGHLCIIIAVLIPFNVFALIPASFWFQDHGLVWLENQYEKVLRFALKGYRPAFFFVGTFIAFLVVGGMFGQWARPPLFFPETEPGNIYVFLQKPVGTDIEATNEFTKVVEDDVLAILDSVDFMVESVIAQVGEGASDPSAGPGGGGNQATPNKALLTIAFVEYQFRNGVNTNVLLERIRNKVSTYPGVQVSVSKEATGPPVGPPINLEVSGEDYEKLIDLTADLKNFIDQTGIEGIEELKSDLETGKPELIVHLDREKAQRFGLSTQKVANELRIALFGVEVDKYKEGEDEYPIMLRLADEYRYDVNALLDQKVTFRDKFGKLKQVPISSVIDVEYSSTYGSVKRKDLNRVITLSSNVTEGGNANAIVAELKEALNDFNIPEGYTIKFTGEQEEQSESTAFLANAFMIAIGLIFLIIVGQFNSVLSPFIILFSVLFSLIGVLLGIMGSNSDIVIIMTGLGIISLAGVVVNNAIVLIDYTNLIRERHRSEMGLEEDARLPWSELLSSIVEAGKTRLRPVLLTAITTVLGLLPLAYGVNINFFELINSWDPQFYMGGDNADFWGPMAWTVIYGLVFATFLTLVIVPVMYLLADRLILTYDRIMKRIN